MGNNRCFSFSNLFNCNNNCNGGCNKNFENCKQSDCFECESECLACPCCCNCTTGATGADGATGATGANGINGVTGATGATGANGTNGATGATGANGTNGINGATGASGTNGTNGANGANGATGATGANGTNGINGATGATGTNGINGATGATGTNGINGATGATGANGTNGVDGAPGAMQIAEYYNGYTVEGAQVVAQNQDVIFASALYRSAAYYQTHGQSEITILYPGAYLFDFGLFYKTAATTNVTFAITFNDLLSINAKFNNISNTASATDIQFLGGKAIINIGSINTKIKIRNTGPTTVTLDNVSGAHRNYLTILKLL